VEDGGCYHGGSGPPVLLLHSGFGSWVEWRSVIELLTPRRTVLAPTLPGSRGGGRLDLSARTMLDAHADRVEEMLNAIGWTEPIQIVGSSYGGVAALELASRRRAGSVIALAPPWVAGSGAAFYAALFGTSLPTFRTAQLLIPQLIGPRTLGLVLHGSITPALISSPDAKTIWRSWGQFPLVRTGVALGRRGQLSPGMPDLQAIHTAVTLLWGGADRIVPGWMRRRWQLALPGAEHETLSDLPHCPRLRDPGQVAARILANGPARTGVPR